MSDNASKPSVVVFDCDGVLVDAVSSWRTLHDSFGTDNAVNLNRFIRGELSDVEFMRSDIQMWKAVRTPIHQDELFRAYAGVKLMPGARETVQRLQDEGVFVAIVSAGVDLFVSSIASMLNVDDWIANGFVFDDDGFLTDEGVCRLHASGKGEVINKLLAMNGLDASGLRVRRRLRDGSLHARRGQSIHRFQSKPPEFDGCLCDSGCPRCG